MHEKSSVDALLGECQVNWWGGGKMGAEGHTNASEIGLDAVHSPSGSLV